MFVTISASQLLISNLDAEADVFLKYQRKDKNGASVIMQNLH